MLTTGIYKGLDHQTPVYTRGTSAPAALTAATLYRSEEDGNDSADLSTPLSSGGYLVDPVSNEDAFVRADFSAAGASCDITCVRYAIDSPDKDPSGNTLVYLSHTTKRAEAPDGSSDRENVQFTRVAGRYAAPEIAFDVGEGTHLLEFRVSDPTLTANVSLLVRAGPAEPRILLGSSS